ncbi:hypothetical protein JCM10450v2_007822 [Rhodotorula kratochvilovae]
MASRKRTLPADWALANPLRPPALRRHDLASSLFAAPLARQTALQAHHSCVNALALSKGDARWLASGGDDKRVLLWDTTALDDDGSGLAPDPKGCYRGARSNIFSIVFSCDGSRIFSAGNDAAILSHDLETSSSTFPHSLDEGVPPLDVWLDHDDSVMGLSAHPSNPSLFLSASSDGALHAFDTRTSPGCTGTIVDMCGMNDVVHHPLTPELFIYSAEDGQMGLVDGRMGWGAAGAGGEDGREARIAREVAVVQYDTTVARQDRFGAFTSVQTARPNVSSSVISPSGTLVCATLSGYLPTLFELSSPTPLACFSSPTPAAEMASRPGPERFPRGYRNTTTTKHGSFGGGAGAEPGRGLYYAAGSDDFRTYVWEVPGVEALREGRREVAEKDLGGRVAFPPASYRPPPPIPIPSSTTPANTPFTLPTSIAPAAQVLYAHRSVVNTALFHPSLPVLYTAGVEKLIIRHAPSSSLSASSSSAAEQKWAFSPRAPAAHASHPGLSGPADAALDARVVGGESAAARERRLRAEDREVLEYFDGLVEGEGDEVLWEEEEGVGCGGGASEDEESGEEDEDEEDEAAAGAGARGSTRRILRMLGALAYDAPRGAGRVIEDASEEDIAELRETLLERVREEGMRSGGAQNMLRRLYSRAWMDDGGGSSDEEEEDSDEGRY